jgi:hypothetical protein
MISNSSLTLYHKGFNGITREDIWTRHNYDKVWWFGGKGASINKGYTDANDVDVRISYKENPDIEHFAIGDIIVKGRLEQDITRQQDLQCEFYNITSINNNTFGTEPHIHIGGK